MPKKCEKNKSNTPVITSPDGVKIEITAGRKWKFCRHYMRSDRTPLQKNIMTVLIDMTNEGIGDDAARFGLAYPSLETLVQETGSSRSGVKKGLDGLKALGDLRLIGEKKNQGGRDKVNEYWLTGWNEFGSVSDTDRNRSHSDTFSEAKTGHSETETGHSEHLNRSLSDPDSSHNSPHRNTSPDSKNTSGVDPAVDDVSDRPQHKPGNDNDPTWPPSPAEAASKFLGVYPKGGKFHKVRDLLEEIRKEGQTKFEDITRGARNYAKTARDTKSQFLISPENFLTGENWLGYQKEPPSRWKRGVAI